MKDVYGYVRVSLAIQTQEHLGSLASQEERIQAFFDYRLKMDGYTLKEIFREEAVSGSVPIAQRPCGTKLMDAVGEGDAVIIPKFDRAWRDTIDGLTTIKAWHAKGVKVFVLDAGGIDLSTEIGELLMTVMLMVAKFERRRIKERLAEARARIKLHHPDDGVTNSFTKWGHKKLKRVKGYGKWMQVPDPNATERKWARWFMEMRRRGLNMYRTYLYCLRHRIFPKGRRGAHIEPQVVVIQRYINAEIDLRAKEARLAAASNKPPPTYPDPATEWHPGGPQDASGSVKELRVYPERFESRGSNGAKNGFTNNNPPKPPLTAENNNA